MRRSIVKAKKELGLDEIDPKQIQGRFDQTIMKILNKNHSYLLDEELQEALSPLLSSADISVWKRSRPVLENWKAFRETPALMILTGERKISDGDDLRVMVRDFKKQVENLASQADERKMNGVSKVIRGIVNKLTPLKKLQELKKLHDEINIAITERFVLRAILISYSNVCSSLINCRAKSVVMMSCR